MAVEYERFIVVSGQTVTLASGTYTNPNYYNGNGAAGEVQSDGTLNAIGTAENKIVFTGNTAYHGGAVYIKGGSATFCDVTFTGNTANYGGAVYINGGSATFCDVTFSGNTANYGGGAVYAFNDNATISLTGTVTLATASDTWGGNGKIITNWDLTHAAPGDSVCINGYRNVNSYAQRITVSPNQTLGDYTIATNASPYGSISFTITGVAGQDDVSITINGNSVQYNGLQYILRTQGNAYVLMIRESEVYERFIVTSGQTVTLVAGSTYTNPDIYDGNGAAGEVKSNGVLTAVGTVDKKIVFSGNAATGNGHAIYTRGKTTLEHVVFRANESSGSVCAFYVAGGTSTLTNVDFIGNGLIADGGDVTLDNVTFSGIARSYTPSVSSGASLAISNSTFTGNGAGAIYVNGGTADFADVVFNGNTANYGGAVVMSGDSATFCNVTFSNNTAIYGGGGAVEMSGDSATFRDVTFSGNTANYGGGAVDIGFGSATFCDVTFSGNTAGGGGAVLISGGTSHITLANVTFDHNYAAKSGGAVYIEGGTSHITLANVTFDHNYAAKSGGAICNSSSSCVITIAGTVTLATDSDTIYNEWGTLNWDLTKSSDTNWVVLNGFQYLINEDSLTITVGGNLKFGDYVIATDIGSDFSGKDTFTLTGLTGTQQITIGGSSILYNDFRYTLKKSGDSLVLSIGKDAPDGIFYCSSWTDGQAISVTWQGKQYSGTVGDGAFFNIYSGTSGNSAKEKSLLTGEPIVVMESGTINKSTSYEAQDTTLSSADAVYNRMVLGGNLKSGNHLDFAGSYTMTVENGTFASDFAGGDAANGYVLRTGDVTVNVSGGTFAKSLAAGSYYATTGSVLGVAAVYGDLTLSISGGSFTGRVYGGNGAMTDQLGSCTALQGNTYLTIDASTNAISFGECVAAGSRGHGIIYGSTNVTVTGNGANLAFADASVLFGGCSGDCYATVGGVRTASTSVMGDRKLTFDGFIGDFNAEIRMFSDITFENNTKLNFADADLDLKEVEKWNFDCTSFASNLNKNQFKGDTISVDTSGLTTSWTLLSGDAAAFADLGSAASVTLGGNTAKWSGSAWSDGTYTLTLDDPKTSLIVTKLA